MDILWTLNSLSDDPTFVFESSRRLRQAVDRFSKGPADFSDYLLGETTRPV